VVGWGVAQGSGPWAVFFCLPKRNQHGLGRGLPGYLILFAPHAFAPQCQGNARGWPSRSIFLLISKHLTAPREILASPRPLETPRRRRSTTVDRWRGTTTERGPPTCPLRPIIPNNTRSSCLTAAAGTEFAGASSGGPGIISPPRKGFTGHIPVVTHAKLLDQACAQCPKFLTAASQRSLGRVSVPV